MGRRDPFKKIAKFNEMGQNLYNFGFGDFDPATGDISDTHVSNNKDMDVIMGTLGSIIYDFTNIFPEALIYIEGTNAARTRIRLCHPSRIIPFSRKRQRRPKKC